VVQQSTHWFGFLGLGAANSLLLIHLHERGLLKGQKTVILEPDLKLKNDKTFCFWATPKELQLMGIEDLVDYSWSSIQIGDMDVKPLNAIRYCHVSSSALYDRVRDIISEYQSDIDWIQESVIEVKNIDSNNIVITTPSEQGLICNFVFDSRPAVWKPSKANESFLWQSFYGWEIETKEDAFDPEVFNMMDFNVEQAGNTQFVYTLPRSSKTALVELTRFGEICIEENESNDLLNGYLLRKGINNYEINHREQGRIPMSTLQIYSDSVSSGHIYLGGAAGRIKPSTGYAFKSMAFDARIIAENVENNYDLNDRREPLERKGRFAFYDRLLLKIIEKYPEQGKHIFVSLFAKVDPNRVLKFLEEKTTVKEDMRVLGSLPKMPFIKEATVDLFTSVMAHFKAIIPLVAALFLGLLNRFDLAGVSFAFLGFGIALIGIPHGAMDHVLLQKEPLKIKGLLGFVSKYLLRGLGIWVLWWMSPTLGLIIFLLYSAWHFGQADFEEWGSPTGFFSFIWGCVLLALILFSHSSETNAIFDQLHVPSVPFVNGMIIENQHVGFEIACLFSAALSLKNRSYKMLISFIALCVSVYLPLLIAFGVYFIFQHSVHGWFHIKRQLNSSHFQLYKIAFPFTMGAFLLFILFFYRDAELWSNQVGAFFVFLSCLSFPHVWEMHRFYGKRKV
jgi:lycopene beta-cyclase